MARQQWHDPLDVPSIANEMILETTRRYTVNNVVESLMD
jgi:hypothetical protein